MSANIETAVTANTAAWWDPTGEFVHDGLMTVEQAVELANLAWQVDLVPVEYLGEETGCHLIVRDTDDAVLGWAGPAYTPIQNQEGFDFLGKVLDESDLQIESALSLRGGKIVVMVAKTPEHVLIAGEEHIPYTTWANYHNGAGAATIYTGNVRAVCENTLQLGKLVAKTKETFRHVGDPAARMEAAQEALQMTFNYTERLKKVGEDLAMTKMSNKEFEAFLKELVPLPEDEKAKDVPRLMKTRDGIRAVYGEEDNLDNIRGTRWGALQAVVEFSDHHRNYNNTAKRFEDILTQQNNNERALKLLAAN